MRTTLGIITAMLLAWILWKPAFKRRPLDRFLTWFFTRIEVTTHPDCKPKYRSCHHGEWTEGPWA